MVSGNQVVFEGDGITGLEISIDEEVITGAVSLLLVDGILVSGVVPSRAVVLSWEAGGISDPEAKPCLKPDQKWMMGSVSLRHSPVTGRYDSVRARTTRVSGSGASSSSSLARLRGVEFVVSTAWSLMIESDEDGTTDDWPAGADATTGEPLSCLSVLDGTSFCGVSAVTGCTCLLCTSQFDVT